jgi:D-aminopeptidase
MENNLALIVGAAKPFRMVSTVAELVEAVEPAGMEAKAVTPNSRKHRIKGCSKKLWNLIIELF